MDQKQKTVIIKPGEVLGHRFVISKPIGRGGFGNVYSGFDNVNYIAVAVKASQLKPPTFAPSASVPISILTDTLGPNTLKLRENNFNDAIAHVLESSQPNAERSASAAEKEKRLCPILESEYWILARLKNLKGFPDVYDLDRHGSDTYLALELLGKSVQKLREERNRNFPLKSILLLTDQLLMRLKTLHGEGFIHGDLKPENMLMGLRKNEGIVHLIDFGLSFEYRNSNDLKHLPWKKQSPMGTVRYMSINVHNGYKPSRRDDLESLAYVLVVLAKLENVPWGKLVSGGRKNVLKMKLSTTPEQLFKGLPIEFADFLRAVKGLSYDEEPHYDEYINMFRRVGIGMGIWYAGDSPFP